MNLLVLIHRLPCPPDRGAKLRAAAELRWLTERHDVWCAGFIDPGRDRAERAAAAQSLAELRSRCRGLAAFRLSPVGAALRGTASLMAGGTATEAFFSSRALRQRVLEWSRQTTFDAILAFSSGVAPLALEIPAGRHVLDLVDFDSRKWMECAARSRWPMRWVYRTEGARLDRREREWLSSFDAGVVCNRREADLLGHSPLREKLHVIETGASPELEPADEKTGRRCDFASARPAEPVVSFLGAMDYPPNVDGACWFGERIWPRILRRRPDTQWWIVGRSPGRSVRALDNGRNIRVTGTVPSVAPYVRATRVCVAPLRLARGVQTKVLTAMAAGRPCVVTSCVNEGIQADPGRELLVADHPESFAEAVVGLLDDADRAEQIGRAAQEWVHRRYQPQEGLGRLERLLQAEASPEVSS